MKIALLLLISALACFADDDDAKRLPPGTARDTVVKVCINCHGSANFRKLRLTEEEWGDQVADMADRGAKATSDELNAIVDYLTQNFGKSAKVRMNSAPMEEIMKVLGFTVKESEAVTNYREANGDFKQWDDLKKVPGVDPKKLEAKKDLMAF